MIRIACFSTYVTALRQIKCNKRFREENWPNLSLKEWLFIQMTFFYLSTKIWFIFFFLFVDVFFPISCFLICFVFLDTDRCNHLNKPFHHLFFCLYFFSLLCKFSWLLPPSRRCCFHNSSEKRGEKNVMDIKMKPARNCLGFRGVKLLKRNFIYIFLLILTALLNKRLCFSAVPPDYRAAYFSRLWDSHTLPLMTYLTQIKVTSFYLLCRNSQSNQTITLVYSCMSFKYISI